MGRLIHYVKMGSMGNIYGSINTLCQNGVDGKYLWVD